MCAVQGLGGVAASHLQYQTVGSTCCRFGCKYFKQSIADAQAAMGRGNRKQKQFFFLVTVTRKNKACGRFANSRNFAIGGNQGMMAISDEQSVFDLTAGPGFAKFWREGGRHHRHDPVDIVFGRDHAAPGRRASGARP